MPTCDWCWQEHSRWVYTLPDNGDDYALIFCSQQCMDKYIENKKKREELYRYHKPDDDKNATQ